MSCTRGLLFVLLLVVVLFTFPFSFTGILLTPNPPLRLFGSSMLRWPCVIRVVMPLLHRSRVIPYLKWRILTRSSRVSRRYNCGLLMVFFSTASSSYVVINYHDPMAIWACESWKRTVMIAIKARCLQSALPTYNPRHLKARPRHKWIGDEEGRHGATLIHCQ